MIILNCMKKTKWEQVKNKTSFGEEDIKTEGFIHCSIFEYWWRVYPIFRSEKEELVLLCIDTEKLVSEVKWEDGDNSGMEYPHVYGVINVDAVVKVLPCNKDENGDFIKTPEFQGHGRL
jgi:uncharacterized protein (DUF952 family)